MSLKDNKKFRFGILGCGMIAGVHAAAIGSIEEAELAGAADFNPDAAKRFCEKWGAHPYASEEEMLCDESIDVICICTPSGFHARLALAVINSGKQDRKSVV